MIKRRHPANRTKSASVALMLVLYSYCCPQTSSDQFLRSSTRQHGESKAGLSLNQLEEANSQFSNGQHSKASKKANSVVSVPLVQVAGWW